MEVGAVKQAFNNEVILLKKCLNQAKIQTIHKLTRKAKTLAEKKAPEHLKEKLKRKAESTVNEVLIMKKINTRDIAKFIVTHKDDLKKYLNKPQADMDKACARLLLHKSLQDKYKFIRGRFGDVPIGDLFMSRQERRKLKKDLKEAQMNKKKGKGKVVNAEGDWNVEDIEMGDDSKNNVSDDDDGESVKGLDAENDDESDGDHNDSDGEEADGGNDGSSASEDDDNDVGKFVKLQPSELTPILNNESKLITSDDGTSPKPKDKPTKRKAETNTNVEVTSSKNIPEKKKAGKNVSKEVFSKNTQEIIPEELINEIVKHIKPKLNKPDKKVKDNKNKNFNEKLQNRKFKKDNDDSLVEGNKVVDPFFITASGENYMSLAEPRQPDEVKEEHKDGNRRERRAAMFGHNPKIKPRRDNFKQNGYNSNKFDKNSNEGFNNRHDRSNDKSRFNENNVRYNDNNSRFNDSKSRFNDGNSKFNSFNEKKFNNNRSTEVKEEKLHPSWEAKKKKSGILPFEGKKIVFDES